MPALRASHAERKEFGSTTAPGLWNGAREIAAYPNPFRKSSTLDFAAPRNEILEAAIYDPAGRLLRRLPLTSGRTPLVWDGTDARGEAVPAGVYLLRIRTETETFSSRMIRLR